MNDILSTEEYMKKVADSLVDISRLFKFEGWLLNIEIPISPEKIPLLQKFVEYLSQKTRELVPFGKIIWYDSVTVKGTLSWQNELNSLNE